MPTSTRRQLIGSIGALDSWANTTNRTARTTPARDAGPGSLAYHLARLDPDRFANATEAQKIAAAEAGKRAYYSRLALASAKARSRGGDAA
jgi:hypothetical protein